MKLRVEQTQKEYYTCVLDEEDSEKVVAYAEKNHYSYEDALNELVDEGKIDLPYMDFIDSDAFFNYVDEEPEDNEVIKC